MAFRVFFRMVIESSSFQSCNAHFIVYTSAGGTDFMKSPAMRLSR